MLQKVSGRDDYVSSAWEPGILFFKQPMSQSNHFSPVENHGKLGLHSTPLVIHADHPAGGIIQSLLGDIMPKSYKNAPD